jgi:hypothetical protein
MGTEEYGIGRLRIHNGTHAEWLQYSAERQEVVDTLWVEKTK